MVKIPIFLLIKFLILSVISCSEPRVEPSAQDCEEMVFYQSGQLVNKLETYKTIVQLKKCGVSSMPKVIEEKYRVVIQGEKSYFVLFEG